MPPLCGAQDKLQAQLKEAEEALRKQREAAEKERARMEAEAREAAEAAKRAAGQGQAEQQKELQARAAGGEGRPVLLAGRGASARLVAPRAARRFC